MNRPWSGICSFCEETAPVVGPPNALICRDCTTVAIEGHGILDAEANRLRESLQELVEALPKCVHRDPPCDRPALWCCLRREPPVFCDEHNGKVKIKPPHAGALRKALGVLEE